jgi:hypothetical protein
MAKSMCSVSALHWNYVSGNYPLHRTLIIFEEQSAIAVDSLGPAGNSLLEQFDPHKASAPGKMALPALC